MKYNNIFIGTSGWSYKHWQNRFYPNDLPSAKWLEFYSRTFKSVEINNTFYRLPNINSFEKWNRETPKDFTFSVKVSRYITHIKKLNDFEDSWKLFINNCKPLLNKINIFLFQFPPSYVCDENSISNLSKFLDKTSSSYDYSFEFRNNTWNSTEVFNLLKKHNAGLVIADSSRFIKFNEITSKNVYFRMHGPKDLFNSKYSSKEIVALASEIKNLNKSGKRVFVYFNNDMGGYAVENAKELSNKLGVDS